MEQAIQLQDQQNFMLGQYVMYAVNAPKKYPKRPFLEKAATKNKTHMMSPEQHEKLMRAKSSKKGA